MKQQNKEQTERQYTKQCPKCNCIVSFKNKRSLNVSIRNNSQCKSCVTKNLWLEGKYIVQVPWNKGIKWLAQTGELNPFYGKKHTDETKQILSQKATGREGGFKSEHCTEEMRINLRSKRVAELLEKGVFKCPNYNKNFAKFLKK